MQEAATFYMAASHLPRLVSSCKIKMAAIFTRLSQREGLGAGDCSLVLLSQKSNVHCKRSFLYPRGLFVLKLDL